MELNVEVVEGIAVASLPCEHLDASNFESFKGALTGVLKEQSKLVMDLSEVQFIDSSGMGLILYCIRQTASTSGGVKICCASQAVSVALRLVRIDRLVDIFATRQQAVDSFLGR